jgi:uncharacterized membrane protein
MTPKLGNSTPKMPDGPSGLGMTVKAGAWLRSTLMSGLAVLVPLGLTIYVLDWIVGSADGLLTFMPEALRQSVTDIRGLGLVFAFVLVLVAGVLARNLVGRFVVQTFNRVVERIPFVASVYKLFRQISETFFSADGSQGFQRVVLVEWPRQGAWTVAFVTGEPSGTMGRAMAARTTGRYLNLFVPTTPNPTAGFFFAVPESETIATDMTTEAAFKVIISMGALSDEDVKGLARGR